VVDPGQLHEAICQAFDEEELRTLCFDLDLDYDALRGDGKDAKARELVGWHTRRGALMDLVKAVQRRRPKNLFWANVMNDETVPPLANQYATAKMLMLSVGRVENRMDALETQVVKVVAQVDRLRTVSWATLTAILFLVGGLAVVTLIAILG